MPAGELEALLSGLLRSALEAVQRDSPDRRAPLEAKFRELKSSAMALLDKDGSGSVTRDGAGGLFFSCVLPFWARSVSVC